MKITDIREDTRGFHLTSVRFVPEEGESGKQASVMNRFYEKLEAAAKQYAESCLKDCALSKYYCCIRGEETEKGIFVTVALARRIPGEASGRKCFRHRWQNGLLREEKMI